MARAAEPALSRVGSRKGDLGGCGLRGHERQQLGGERRRPGLGHLADAVCDVGLGEAGCEQLLERALGRTAGVVEQLVGRGSPEVLESGPWTSPATPCSTDTGSCGLATRELSGGSDGALNLLPSHGGAERLPGAPRGRGSASPHLDVAMATPSARSWTTTPRHPVQPIIFPATRYYGPSAPAVQHSARAHLKPPPAHCFS